MNNEPSTIISYEVSSTDKSIGIYRGGIALFRNRPTEDRRPVINNVPMIPLQESGISIEQVYSQGIQSKSYFVGTKDGREVMILTDHRQSRSGYNYVGLIDGSPSNPDEMVECWNKDGKAENNSENQLYLFPQEMRGFIGIWQGKTTPVMETSDDALNNLKASYGSNIELKDVFVVPVYWYANPDRENVPL